MARTKKDPADAVAALLDSVSATSPSRRGRPKGSKNKPKAAAAAAPAKTVSRRGRPKGSKNKRSAAKAPAKRAAAVAPAPKAAVAIKPVVRRRRRRAAKAPVVQTLSQRVDSMIAELGKLRAEVGQLEKLRDVLKAINE